MFEALTVAPPDPILGLNDAFRKDSHPHKVNLSVGVYKDAAGNTPILQCVKEAERRLLESESNKSYLPIEGSPAYGKLVRELLFGTNHEIVTSGRAVTAHTPGGTGALRVAADFIKRKLPVAKVWFSKPTWDNHLNIFSSAGLPVDSYAYIDTAGQGLDFPGLLAALEAIPAGDAICLHAGCHNPTGIDPSPEQWRQIADVVQRRGLLPLVDFAYQGFGAGLAEDAAGLRELARPGQELLVCSSFSKNFGLYNERVGALTVVAPSAAAADAALSHVKVCIRVNYSNPPCHGAAIVATVLGDATLRSQWEGEVAEMRQRIARMRQLFVDTMKQKSPGRDFSFICRQRGMFSFSGLTPLQVDELRTKHGVYIVVNGGRINVAGMTEGNIDSLCSAIAAVIG
ncbi:MAG: amino acid aminotransferase [Pirellulales bacterium]